jgi:excisionase family DNA binding protein
MRMVNKKAIVAPFKQYRRTILKMLWKKAEVRHFTFHALRHAGASLMDHNNVPIGSIQRILGHENRSTTEIYLHTLRDAERNPQGPRLMTIKQACAYSGLTDWCLRNLIWTGRLPFVRFGEKKVFIERADLDELIDRSKEVFGV